jgi:hypothetical protein
VRREDARKGMRVLTTLAGVWTTATVVLIHSEQATVRFIDPADPMWVGAEAERPFDRLDFASAVDALASLG